MAKRENLSLIIYYIVLLLILSLKTSVGSEPPMILRLAYLGALILPCILTKRVSYPAIITLFLTVGHYGFSYSYMPYMTYIYGLLTIVMTLLLYSPYRRLNDTPPIFFVIFTIYVFIVDFLTGIDRHNAHFPEDVDWCFLMLLCFFYFTVGNYKKTQAQFDIAFISITIVLSIYFLSYRDVFIQDYDSQSGLERSGWADPNYFGMVIGMGALIGVYKILSSGWKHLNFIEKLPYLSAVIISLPTLLLNASRGALLSLIVSFVFILLFSKVEFKYKLALTIIASIGILWLYQNQYFELLMYRIEADDGTGSSRTVIWEHKLQLYSQGNILQWLFGYGYTGGFYLTGRALGFHNDFIAFLVDYGIAGLGMFLYMLFYPLSVVRRNSENHSLVIAIIVYLIIGCFTLEPFTHALMMFFAFYFYALISAKINSK